MVATHNGRIGQANRIRAAFNPLLDAQLCEISAGQIEPWRAERQRRKRHEKEKPRKHIVSAATLNRDLAALRAAFARAVEWGHMSSNPLQRYRRGSEDGNAVIRFLSTDEERRLRDALKSRDDLRRDARNSANEWRRQRGYHLWSSLGVYTDHLTPFVLLALNTGLRRGELLNLRWRDINLKRALLTVEGGGSKSGQTRHLPLNTEAKLMLEVWKGGSVEADALVFPGPDPDSPMTEAKKGWGTLLVAADVSNFRFDDLRHTFASKLVMAGVDLNTVRELLGHTTIAMTLRYAHLAPEHKAAAVERLIPR
jgi:integrase